MPSVFASVKVCVTLYSPERSELLLIVVRHAHLIRAISPLAGSRVVSSKLLAQEIAVHDGLVHFERLLDFVTCAIIILDTSRRRERLHQRIEIRFKKEWDPERKIKKDANKIIMVCTYETR